MAWSLVPGQVATGGFNATSGNATLPSGTTAGNTVLVAFATYTRSMATTAGFVIDSAASAATTRIQLFRRSNVPAAETSWAFTTGVANACAWVAVEIEGMDPTTPLDVSVAAVTNVTTGTSISTGTTPTSTTYDGLVLGLVGASISGTTPGTLSAWTGGYTEIGQSGQAGPTNSAVVGLALLGTESLSTFSTSASHSATLTVSFPGAGWAVVYTAANAKRAANVVNMAGFEQGLAAGLATGAANAPAFDTIGGTPAIVSTNPRSGSYCLELSSSAAAEWVQWAGAASFGSAGTYAVPRFGVYFPSSLPSGDLDLFNLAGASGANVANQNVTLRYRSASQKLGIQIRDPVGAVDYTEVLSALPVVVNAWYAIDIRYSAPTLTVDWQVDGVDQAQASALVMQPSSTLSLGWFGASTGTVRYDDVVLSRTPGHYPLGNFRILPLKPDPAGTLTISGTTANFNTFSANGTMAAWNAATALAAIDDLPPTIGASADGIAQITLAASDYVEIPMETYDAPANGGVARAVRMYACGWGAGSPAAATIGFRGYEGSAETVLWSVADPAFTNSTTTPGWVCKMFKPTGGWTQAKLDTLAFRMGFSGDATPDIGIHSIMAEVAIQQGTTETMFGTVGDVQVTVDRAPDSSGIITMTTVTPEGKATALHYEESGTPTDVTVAPASSRDDVLDAPDHPSTNYVAIYPDPEGVADT